MKKKLQLIIDMDNTCTNSCYSIFELYQKETGDFSSKYKKHDWNFKGIIPSSYLKRAIDLFGTKQFYDNLTLIDDCKDVLNRLKQYFEIIICSKCVEHGLDIKLNYIKNNIPCDRIVFIIQNDFEKNFVGDNDLSIIVDDTLDAMGGKRYKKILFGDYLWNEKVSDKWLEENNVVRNNNWLDLEKRLMNLYIKYTNSVA